MDNKLILQLFRLKLHIKGEAMISEKRKISIKETQLNQFISSLSNAQIIYLTHEATFYGMGYSHLRNNCVRRGMIK